MLLIRSIRKSLMSTIKTKFVDYEKGGPVKLFLNEREIHEQPDHYLMRVKAIGLNRAETLQRMGKYAISKEVEKFLGLEAAGEIVDPNTQEKLFDGIALLSGGSYAEWAWIPKTHVMPLPKDFSYVQGACIPEAWLTAFQLLQLGQVKQGDKVVIYAAASGVGTALIQICHILGAEPYGVVSTEKKGELCKKLGAKDVVYYKDNDEWSEELLKINNGKQFNVVLDCVCAGNVPHSQKLLGIDSRWVIYGLMSGFKTELNFADILTKRVKVIGTVLKPRSKEYKDKLIEDFSKVVLHEFETQKCQPIISEVLKCDWKGVDSFIEGHKIMENNQNAGKIIIEYI